MHQKVDYLFTQKTQRENKLPLPQLRLLFQILFNINFSTRYLQAKLSRNLTVTFNFMFIFFHFNFYYFL